MRDLENDRLQWRQDIKKISKAHKDMQSMKILKVVNFPL